MEDGTHELSIAVELRYDVEFYNTFAKRLTAYLDRTLSSKFKFNSAYSEKADEGWYKRPRQYVSGLGYNPSWLIRGSKGNSKDYMPVIITRRLSPTGRSFENTCYQLDKDTVRTMIPLAKTAKDPIYVTVSLLNANGDQVSQIHEELLPHRINRSEFDTVGNSPLVAFSITGNTYEATCDIASVFKYHRPVDAFWLRPTLNFTRLDRIAVSMTRKVSFSLSHVELEQVHSVTCELSAN